MNLKQSTSLFDKEIESVILQNQSIEDNPLSHNSNEKPSEIDNDPMAQMMNLMVAFCEKTKIFENQKGHYLKVA